MTGEVGNDKTDSDYERCSKDLKKHLIRLKENSFVWVAGRGARRSRLRKNFQVFHDEPLHGKKRKGQRSIRLKTINGGRSILSIMEQ